jgi:hypothetical protein
MKAPGIVGLALVLSLPLAGCGDRIAELTPQSEFIFVGTVLLLNSSTIDADDPQGLAVVRVDEIVRPADAFAASPGDQITVRLVNPADIRPNTKRLFFTKSWYFGESLAVTEVGNTDPPSRFASLQEEVEGVRRQVQERLLRERIQRAELIVRGVVQKISRLPDQRDASEHAPDWYAAEIKIDEVLKGRHTGETVTILFPQSDDVMWYRAPKFTDSTRGVWLLKTETLAGRKMDYRSALTQEDFFPQQNEAQILRLLK